jgi:asparagine synthetase B (glutamine-hydrolysing)
MCGICGWLNHRSASNVERSTLERMNATLTHRGPDDTGALIYRNPRYMLAEQSLWTWK